MPAAENKALIRRCFEELVNKGQLDRLSEVIAPTYVNHDMPMPAPGPEGLSQVLQPFLTAFPDFHVRIDDVLGEGDRVMTRGVFTGTQRGAFMGIPVTGKAVRVSYMDEWRVENGKAVENWVRLDMLSLMQQLGAVPDSTAAPA
jgi:steroid delta-isomerase-like uncharacterized protein